MLPIIMYYVYVCYSRLLLLNTNAHSILSTSALPTPDTPTPSPLPQDIAPSSLLSLNTNRDTQIIWPYSIISIIDTVSTMDTVALNINLTSAASGSNGVSTQDSIVYTAYVAEYLGMQACKPYLFDI